MRIFEGIKQPIPKKNTITDLKLQQEAMKAKIKSSKSDINTNTDMDRVSLMSAQQKLEAKGE